MTRREWIGRTFAAVGAGAVARRRPVLASRADPTDLSLLELIGQLGRREVSPLEVVDAYLDRIRRLDPDLHAYVTVTADAARQQARQLAAGNVAGRPLFGLPIAHKDLFETAGVRTTGGSRLFESYLPERDATLVARLTAAGAVSLGKTNTHELGGGVTTINPVFGTTRNPRDGQRIAGGSSGGSAAAVAARLAAAATGSDTGGSVRIPAALCGCVGFKPTFGLLSTAGVLGAAPTFDHSGFLTRYAADLVPLLQASMGVDPRDPASVPQVTLGADVVALRGVRVGVPRRYFFDALDGDVGRALDAALTRIGSAGAVVREVQAPVDTTTMARVFDPIAIAEIHQTYERDWVARPQLFSASFAEFFTAPVPGGLELAAAHRARRAFQAAMTRLFDEVEVLAMPTVPVVAPRIDGAIDGNAILRNTWPFNASRLPAVTLPCGPGDRLPVGLQLVGAPFEDARLLGIAAAVERSLG